MVNIKIPRLVRLSEQVLFQEIEGEAVLLNLKNEQYFGLNEIGTRLWHLLAENEETANLLTHLQSEYEVDEETLKNDLSVLINDLKTQGLVTVED